MTPMAIALVRLILLGNAASMTLTQMDAHCFPIAVLIINI
jgi:hypothetical protein